MRVWGESNAHFDCLSTDLVERVGESLQLIVRGSAFRSLSHVAFPHVAPEREQKVSGESDMVFDGLWDFSWINEVGRLTFCTV